MIPNCRLLLACFLGFPTFLLCAQDADEGAGREIRLLAWEPISLPLTLGSGENAVALSLGTDQFTVLKGKQVPRGKTIEIQMEVSVDMGQPAPADPIDQGTAPADAGSPNIGPQSAAPNSGGRKRRVLYASAQWPARARHVIGFLAPAGDAIHPKGKLIFLPDSEQLHPEHSMRAINLTEAPLRVRLGGKEATLPVRGDLVTPFDPSRLRIDIAINDGGDWKHVTGSYLATAKHYRCFALIRTPVNPNPLFPTDQPDIMGVFEQTSPLPPRTPLPAPPQSTP